MSRQIASNLPFVCDVGASTYTRTLQRSERFFNTDMLQLPAGRRRDSTRGLQACNVRDAKKEVQRTPKKGVLIKIYQSSSVLCSSTLRQLRAMPGWNSLSGWLWAFKNRTAKGKKRGQPVSQCSKCTQFASGQHVRVQSNNCSTVDYSRVRWCSAKGI
jgi:hypothetical protein